MKIHKVYISYYYVINMKSSDYVFNPMRICGRVLKEPKLVRKKLRKGAIILACPDKVIEEIPELKDYFYIIERRGWNGMTDANSADIKLVEDPTKWEETREQLPGAILLDVAGGDFVNTDTFYPLSSKKRYTGIQIARWCQLKRHELFVRAVALTPYQFIKSGNFYRGGTVEEIKLREDIMKLSESLNAGIEFPYSNLVDNEGFADAGKINLLINRSKIGILTSLNEGNNRFKTECMSADIPVLIPEDIAGGAAKKHLNSLTGALFEPSPEGLAKAIETTLRNYTAFHPRSYILENTGIKRSTRKLVDALNTLARMDGLTEYFEGIYWDGREQTLVPFDQIYEHILESIDGVRGDRL